MKLKEKIKKSYEETRSMFESYFASDFFALGVAIAFLIICWFDGFSDFKRILLCSVLLMVSVPCVFLLNYTVVFLFKLFKEIFQNASSNR